MPEITPFIAASPGASQHLQANPLLQRALKEGIYKDVWGSTYSEFMSMDYGGSPSGEIPDNAQGRTQAFTADVSVYRCVDIRGAAIASVPLKIFDSVDPTKRLEIEHEAMDVLQAGNPFGWVAGPNLMRYSLGSRDLHGSFAWRIVTDRGGRARGPLPREIYWLPPGQYKPLHGKDLEPPQRQVPFGGLRITPADGRPEYTLPADEVIYAPTYNPTDPLRGTSRISALRTDLNLRLYGQNSNIWFFRNNQRPDVVVTGAFAPTVENVGLMRRIWKAAFGGDGNRGPAFLPSDMRVNLLTMTQKDAEWLGQRQAAREDILAAFGVPPPVYGDLARATYENIRTAYEGFWRSGMIPELDDMAWVLTQQLLWKWPDARKGRYVFAFDYQAIEALQEDANSIWERTSQLMDRLNAAVGHRALLPNQMRAIAEMLFKQAGLPDAPWKGKVPGGDMFYVPLNNIPVIEASVQANVDAQAARAGVTAGQSNKPGNGRWLLPDATEVTGEPVAPGTPGDPNVVRPETEHGPGPLQPAPAPAPKVMIHNHLTKLEWPQLPQFPEPPEPPEYPAPEGPRPKDGQGLRSGPSSDATNLVLAQMWLTRRLKRHFGDQQAVALRALRNVHEVPSLDDARPGVDQLVDVPAGLEDVQEIVDAALAMAGLQADVNAVANDIEGTTARLLGLALAPQAGDEPRAVQDRVRAVFRTSIEVRATSVALDVIKARSEEAA